MHTIYQWFVGLYHENLYNFLAGFDCDMMHTQANQFNGTIGIVTLLGVALLTCLFYFTSHAKFNGIFSWLFIMLLVAVFSWNFGYWEVKGQHNDMPNYVIYGIENCEGQDDAYYDEDGEEVSVAVGCNALQPIDGATPVITNKTYVGFGFANMFIGIIYFILISFIIKRFSLDCRHTPWPSIWPKH